MSCNQVVLYFDVTDKGLDQVCRKRLTAEAIEASRCPNIVYVPGFCFLHMFHACVKGGLSLVDELMNSLFDQSVLNGFTRYFGSLSKVVNTWRERAADVMAAWTQHFKDADLDTMKLGRRYPLAVISGRWGSVESAEDFMLTRGRDKVVPVLLAVLSKHMRADVSKSGSYLV